MHCTCKQEVLLRLAPLDTEVFGCQRLHGGNCSAVETAFVNKMRRHYRMGRGTWTMRSMLDGATCAAIRNLHF